MPTKEQARATLEHLIAQYQEKDSEKHLSESDVIQKYLEVVLRDVLGWKIGDSDRYRRELHTEAGRPDLTYTAENGELIFVEAKRFGVIPKLEDIKPEGDTRTARRTNNWLKNRLSSVVTPEQLRMPGIAIDRTQEEQQAINYAFKLNGQWAILWNFERLRLFNARRDWLVLSFESPDAYLEDFDLLWELSHERIINGSLDYLSNQRHREDIDSDYLELISEWRETMANDILHHPKNNGWAFADDGGVNLLAIRDVVQRVIDRLVVIRFAEDHLVIPSGTLYSTYELRKKNPYTFSMDEFIDRFFHRFDEDHNSALFARHLADEAEFSDAVLEQLIRDLYLAKYRAMPADILGNTYEQYLGKALALDGKRIISRDNLETRKKQGSYYTPQVIVRYLVDNSLGRYLYGTANGQADGEPLDGERRKTSAEIRDLRVLDSACGSGSFLINAYQVLAKFYESEIKRLESEIREQTNALARQGMQPIDIHIELSPLTAEIERIGNYPNLILETHIYGTDLDPQAAEIAVVNLMMRAMERQGASEHRLPLILNQNVKVGNALIGLRYDDPRLLEHADALARVRALRLELVGTLNTDPRHDEIVEELASERAALYALFEDEFAGQFSDLNRVRPFHWGIEFPEVFYDAQGKLSDASGFDVIIGNPPWEIVKPNLREFYAQFDEDIASRLSRAKAEARIEELNAENSERLTSWQAQVTYIEEQAAYFRASEGYTRQGRGDTATHKLFTERMYDVLAHRGRLSYVIPSGIYTDLGTKELREMLLNEGSIEYLYSFSNERFFFPGVDHRFKFCLLGAQKGSEADGFWTAFRFNPRVAVAPADMPDFLSDESNLVYMLQDSIEQFSPDSLSLMEFQSKADYQTTFTIYDRFPLLGDESENNWNVRLTTELHMTNDRHLFNTAGKGLPLYEGKMFHQFDAFFAEPSYWLEEAPAANRLQTKTGEDYLNYRVVFRDIASSTNERTLISAIIPKKSFCNNKAPIIQVLDTDDYEMITVYICAVLNSLMLDFVIRQKVTTTLNFFYMYTLPLPRLTAGNPYFDALVPRAARLTCTDEAFADLWQDVMGEPWSLSQAATDDDERQQLRDEIDALVAHLYGLSRDEFAHILSTFPLVFPDTEIGTAKKARLLAVYDDFASVTADWSRG